MPGIREIGRGISGDENVGRCDAVMDIAVIEVLHCAWIAFEIGGKLRQRRAEVKLPPLPEAKLRKARLREARASPEIENILTTNDALFKAPLSGSDLPNMPGSPH
jgi:hypothetical protein